MCDKMNKYGFYRVKYIYFMKRLKRSKYFILLTLALSTIISVSACSLATPETVFISNIELTDNPDEVMINISDADYNKWELIYDIPSMEMRKPSNSVNTTKQELTPSELIFDSQLISNNSDGFWKLTN